MSSETKFTPGPWQWEMAASGHVRLATPDRGRLVVMDFVRKGMQNAEPRFAVMSDDQSRGRRGGTLRSFSEILSDDPEGLLSHPDAILIASAPKLYEALDALSFALGAAYVQYLQGDMSGFDEFVKSNRIEFKTDGSPRLVCPALASARGEG